jgi:hypothetical protein
MHPFVELAVSCAALHAFVRVTVACVNSCLITGWARHVCGHACLPGGGRERGRRVTCRVGSVGLLAEVHGRLCTLYSAQCLVPYTRPAGTVNRSRGSTGLVSACTRSISRRARGFIRSGSSEPSQQVATPDGPLAFCMGLVHMWLGLLYVLAGSGDAGPSAWPVMHEGPS